MKKVYPSYTPKITLSQNCRNVLKMQSRVIMLKSSTCVTQSPAKRLFPMSRLQEMQRKSSNSPLGISNKKSLMSCSRKSKHWEKSCSRKINNYRKCGENKIEIVVLYRTTTPDPSPTLSQCLIPMYMSYSKIVHPKSSFRTNLCMRLSRTKVITSLNCKKNSWEKKMPTVQKSLVCAGISHSWMQRYSCSNAPSTSSTLRPWTSLPSSPPYSPRRNSLSANLPLKGPLLHALPPLLPNNTKSSPYPLQSLCKCRFPLALTATPTSPCWPTRRGSYACHRVGIGQSRNYATSSSDLILHFINEKQFPQTD